MVKPPALRISYITSAFSPHCSGTGRCPSPVAHRHGWRDRTEQAKRNGGGYFMMERVTASVAWLASMFSLISFSRPNVSGSHRPSQHRNHIDVWSVLRFRFDKQRALETDFMFMLNPICIKRPSCSRSWRKSVFNSFRNLHDHPTGHSFHRPIYGFFHRCNNLRCRPTEDFRIWVLAAPAP